MTETVKETLIVNELGGMKGDGDKLDYTLLEWTSFRDLVKLMMFGAKKYNRDNWRKVEPLRYKQALLRHVAAFAEGEWTDAYSGVPHCACIMFNAMVLIWFKKEGKLDDTDKN
jgi:hypothetical protein